MAFYVFGCGDHNQVEQNVIGSSKLGWYKRKTELLNLNGEIPESAKKCLGFLDKTNHTKSLAVRKYFADMNAALASIHSSLRVGGKLILIVGTQQQFSAGAKRAVLPLGNCISEIAQRQGLDVGQEIRVDLTKNNDGDIKEESIFFLSR